MVKVSLEGRVGKSLGKKWKLHVGTVGEAIRAIRANTGNAFAEALGVSRGYAVIVDGVPVAPDAYFLKKIKKSLVLIPILAGGGSYCCFLWYSGRVYRRRSYYFFSCSWFSGDYCYGDRCCFGYVRFECHDIKYGRRS